MPDVDLLFLAHNRLEFTRESLAALAAGTDWDRVALHLYDDLSTDGAGDVLKDAAKSMGGELTRRKFGSPVAAMNDLLLRHTTREFVAKVDNDTVVPPGWLDECLGVMDRHPELDLLGIEAFTPPGDGPRTYRPGPHIGGIGLFRRRAFRTRPNVDGRFFGFTAWQQKNARCGWIAPALPVFLLDRMPTEPWRSLTERYIGKGWQRRWNPSVRPDYDAQRDAWMWKWWTPSSA